MITAWCRLCRTDQACLVLEYHPCEGAGTRRLVMCRACGGRLSHWEDCSHNAPGCLVFERSKVATSRVGKRED